MMGGVLGIQPHYDLLFLTPTHRGIPVWLRIRDLLDTLFLFGDPAGTQTQDLQNRNLTLYSTKLRSLVGVRFAAEMGCAHFMLRDSSSQIGKIANLFFL